MTGVALLGAALGAWVAWAPGAHLAGVGGRRRGTATRRAVALTFDDGPDATWTPAVLDILRREQIRATFFLVGRRASAAPDVVRRAAGEGHELGNHTWSHPRLWLAGPGTTRHEIERGHEAISRAAGTEPRFFRAPWGLGNLAVGAAVARLGTPPVGWTVQPEGLGPVAPERQLARSLARAEAGAIYDLHDADGVPGAGCRVAAYLPALIGGLRRAGYALVPLGDLV